MPVARPRCPVLALCALVWLGAPVPARSQGPAERHADGPPAARAAVRPLAADLRETVLPLVVTVQDLQGRRETHTIAVTVYRPPGEAPRPLLVFNHGRAPQQTRAVQGRMRPEALARWLVGQGFVVMVPTRVGYGETYGDFDPEASGPCRDRQVEPMHTAAVHQVLATVALARELPWIDARRWVVMGQSVGGQTAVATVAAAPDGLVGGINLSGGSGGDPRFNPGRPCQPERIGALWQRLAATAQVPMLWLYWVNDRYWGPDVPRQWHAAWTAGGAPARFEQLPPSGEDGHRGIDQDMAGWTPRVQDFLRTLFPQGAAAP